MNFSSCLAPEALWKNEKLITLTKVTPNISIYHYIYINIVTSQNKNKETYAIAMEGGGGGDGGSGGGRKGRRWRGGEVGGKEK